jgi:hypothetical protein
MKRDGTEKDRFCRVFLLGCWLDALVCYSSCLIRYEQLAIVRDGPTVLNRVD